MFGVDADAAQVALQCSDGNFAAAGQLLCQQQQREARKAVLQARDEAVRQTRDEERGAAAEAVREAMECDLCMEAPRTHSFMPCGHHCACVGCAEEVMRRNKRCPYCREQAESIQRIFVPSHVHP